MKRKLFFFRKRNAVDKILSRLTERIREKAQVVYIKNKT